MFKSTVFVLCLTLAGLGGRLSNIDAIYQRVP